MFYVIQHKASSTYFGIRNPESVKPRICCFPNHNHATRVADNIARFYYAQNKLPDTSDPDEYKSLFSSDTALIYDNYFTPFDSSVKASTMNVVIETMQNDDLLDYCLKLNADLAFCIIANFNQNNEKVYMFDLDGPTRKPLSKKEDPFL